MATDGATGCCRVNGRRPHLLFVLLQQTVAER